MKIKFLIKIHFLSIAILSILSCKVYSAGENLRSKLSVFEQKQAKSKLDDALKSLNVGVVKEIILKHKGLLNDETMEPVIFSVVRVNRQDKANEQLELLDFLLNIEGIDVNRVAPGALRQNTLDVAVKGIQLGRNEGTKNRYKAIAQKLLNKGASLSALASNTIAQQIVNGLSIEPVVVDLPDTSLQAAKEKEALIGQHEKTLVFLINKEKEESKQLGDFLKELEFKKSRIESIQRKIDLIEEELSQDKA